MRLRVMIALAAVLSVGAVSADINFGGDARSIAMGGAGIALLDDPLTTGVINPAAYAVRKPGFRALLPSLDFRVEGSGVSDFLDVARKARNSSGSNAIELAKSLGKRETMAELTGYAGIAAGSFVVTADIQTTVGIDPTPEFQGWANDRTSVDWADELANRGIADLRTAYRADIKGHTVYALPSVAMGFKAPNRDDLNVGVRLKSLHSSAQYERVRPASIDGNGNPVFESIALVPEVKDSGIAADIGLIYQTPNAKRRVTTAVVVTNIVKPSLAEINLDSMLSVGAAFNLNDKITLATDIVNVNKAYDEGAKIRFGAEVTPLKWLTLRAGYCEDGPTFGFRAAGFDFAFSKDAPAMAGRVWRF